MDPVIAAHAAKWLARTRMLRASQAGDGLWEAFLGEMNDLERRMTCAQYDESRRRVIAARTAELEAGQE
jgi:hypothetical protein